MATSIQFQSLYKGFRLLHKKNLSAWLQSAVLSEKLTTGEITILFCTDDYLLEINRQYLDHDYFTDIITFDYTDNQMVSGDLLISIDRVRENAKTYGCSLQEELRRVMIHGVLHLCGYKDKRSVDKKLMTSKEDHYLKKFKIK